MNVCLVVREYPESLDEPIVSGMVKNPYQLSTFLRERGHDVTIVAHDMGAKINMSPSKSVYRVSDGYLRGAVRSASGSFIAARKLHELLQTREFDLVNAHYPTPGIGIMRQLGDLDLPFVSTAHGTILPEIQANRRSSSLRDKVHLMNAVMKKRFDQYAWNRSDLVIPVGEFQTTEMEELYGIPTSKMHAIPNGVDIERYRPDDKRRVERRTELGINDEPVILFVGRLVQKKGVQYLLDAACAVLSDRPDARFVVVGGTATFDEYGEQIRRQVDRLGLLEQVDIRMGVAEARMPSYYNAADVCVVPSINYEPLPTVVFEAMASGTPVIGSDLDGIPYQLDDDRTLIPQKDSEALTAKITELIGDDRLRTAIGDQFRVRAMEHFDWRDIAGRYADAYREILEGE